MEKLQYVCPKCGCTQYESDQFQATGGNFAKLFDVQNKKFVTVSCVNCGYTELYKVKEKHGLLQIYASSNIVYPVETAALAPEELALLRGLLGLPQK